MTMAVCGRFFANTLKWNSPRVFHPIAEADSPAIIYLP
jgi:hypothetical protein